MSRSRGPQATGSTRLRRSPTMATTCSSRPPKAATSGARPPMTSSTTTGTDSSDRCRVGTAVEVSFRLDYGEPVRPGRDPRARRLATLAEGRRRGRGRSPPARHGRHARGLRLVCPACAEWSGDVVTVRVSRAGDALTVRARRQDHAWQFVRLAPWPPGLAAQAGPYCCAPTRAGLQSPLHRRWRTGPADLRLHE